MIDFKKVLAITILLILNAGLVSAQEVSFISKSLSEETITGPNGAVTVEDALKVTQLMGAEKKVVQEITKDVYHIRGWGIAHTIAIDAPDGWIIIDTGDSTKTAAEMREQLELKIHKKIKVSAILYTHSHLYRWDRCLAGRRHRNLGT